VTAVHEMSLDAADLEVLLGHRSRLPVDVAPILASMSLPEAMERRLGAIGGDLPIDGSIGARTAALSHAYDDGADSGELYHDDDAMAEFFHAAHNAGLQVGVHAIGDRAIEQVLATWERVYLALDSRERRHFRARRHRIEHFVLPSADQIERTAMLGLAVSVQPAFDRLWGQGGGMYEERLGPARAMAAHPIRTMLERGIEVGVGSDAPVAPLDPMLAIAALEEHHEPTQRLTRLEGLKLHRVGSARLGRQDGKKGALEPGWHADFAAYDADPLDATTVEGLRPVLTVSLGREVFRA
jgi:predicted amidohydrolase YtcJ